MIKTKNHVLSYPESAEREERHFILSYPKTASQAAIDVFTSRIRDLLTESGIESLSLYAFDKENLLSSITRPDSSELHADFFVDKAKLEMTLDEYLSHLLVELKYITDWFKAHELNKLELGLKDYLVKMVSFNMIGQHVIFTITGRKANGTANRDNTH